MKTVWITGANGLIGHHLVSSATRHAPTWRVRALTRNDFDLLDFSAVERAFRHEHPEMIIHCAAISVVSAAQKDPVLAQRVNVDATRHLAELAEKNQFAFFSTDLVFDGKQGNYSEADTPNPLHLYGETKLAAEQIVLKNPRHLVVRTSINAGPSPSGQRAFDEQLRSTLQTAGQGMTLFTDEFRCPIAAAETARAVWELMQKNCVGIYHVAGAEKLSRWEIAQHLLPDWPEIKTTMKSGSAKDFPGPPRALDTSFNVAKAQAILREPLPKFSDWLTNKRR